MDEIATNFLNDVVPADFDVQRIAGEGTEALYAGVRRDVLVFLHASITRVENRFSINIDQSHVPRFLIAEAVAASEDTRGPKSAGTADSERVRTWIGGLTFGPSAAGGLRVELSGLECELPESFCREDVEAYRRAVSKVAYRDGLHVLPRSKSHTGKPVASVSRRLIEAVAFEREIHRRLDAHRFGAYSAFCTWKDFCEDQPRERSFYRQLVDGQFLYDAEAHDYGDFMDLALEVQDTLLSQRIWGVGVEVEAPDAAAILQEGMGALDSIQIAQFNLMNGMHEGGLFLPLAQILGLNGWESYIEWKTDGEAPDSDVEQRLRSEVAIIALLGELGGEPIQDASGGTDT